MEHHHNNTRDPHISSLSEFDSFSDSDWLDISSSRESDTESLSSRDSDHIEVASSSLSRRSSFSTSSSRDGDVEAWEGFVEDNAGEDVPQTDSDQPCLTTESQLLNGLFAQPVGEGDSAEERLVRDGLDQSVISTLSASRSSSHPSTVQNSLRDLRLSFPDPLTSSRNDLNRSYDTVSPTQPNSSTCSEDDESLASVVTSESMSVPDPGLLPTPEVLAQDNKTSDPIDKLASDFEVVLYGRPSSVKWTFVRDLLRKATLGNVNEHSSTHTGRSLVDCDFDDTVQFIDNIPVKDRTYGSSAIPRSGIPPNRPSLAIIYLPCLPPLLDEHTLYLPVITPRSDEPHSFDNTFEMAQAAWSAFTIPANRVLRLEGCSSSCMFAAEDIDKLDPALTHKSLRQLFTPLKSGSWSGLFEQFNAAHAVTIFALLCLVAGFSVNTAYRVQTTKGPTIIPLIPPSRVSLDTAFSFNSSAVSLRTTTSLATIPVPLNNSPAILSRRPTSLSTPPTPLVPAIASSSKDPQTSVTESKLVIKAMKDLIIRPTTEPKDAPIATSPPEPTSYVKPEQEQPTAISLRLVDSLSEIVEASVKALIEVVYNDVNDLILAIDDLMRAINRQKHLIIEQSKSTAQIVREELEYRHNRAKGKARELKEKGTQLMLRASDKFLGRAEMARIRAHRLKDTVTSSYTKAQGEWSNRFQKHYSAHRTKESLF